MIEANFFLKKGTSSWLLHFGIATHGVKSIKEDMNMKSVTP